MKHLLAFFSKHLAVSLMAATALAVFALLVFDSAGVPEKADEGFVPHVLCTSWRTVIKRWGENLTILAEKTKDVRQGDQIRTLRQSTATVFWNDGSVTRLAENTTIDVSELVNDKKTASSKIDFSLVQGKTWSRVYRYLSEDSHFHERFDDGSKLAAVRGTAFEINADQGYLRTKSHAVDVTDGAGKILATVPEGVAVNVRNLQSTINAALDAAWEQSNVAEDSKYALEVAKKAKEELAARFAEMKNSPVAVGFSGDSLSVSLSPEYAEMAKTGKVAYSDLLKAYEATAAFAADAQTIRSKEVLRDAILQAAPENEKSKLATEFARHETFDSWTAEAAWEEFLGMRKKLEEYVRMGASDSEIQRMESALPKERIEQFNSLMEGVKKTGIDALSNPELFKTPAKDAFDSATKNVQTTLDGVKELIPKNVTDVPALPTLPVLPSIPQ